MSNTVYTGILTANEANIFLLKRDGGRVLEENRIWDGYIKHWDGQNVCARLLQQKDYENGEPIVFIWPDISPANVDFMELYYNERLVKYWPSLFGHSAICVNGRIYNYSHLINENEVISIEEYFYRPALGEFAPSPNTGLFEILDDGTAYYDKFGRNFMRTIHVLRVEGINGSQMRSIFDRFLEMIHNTPVNPKKPEKWADFNLFTNSCSTLIKHGLRKYGFSNINGILPRDVFVSAAYEILKYQNRENLSVSMYSMPQLKVPEAPYSKLSPFTNPKNLFLNKKLPAYN